MHDRHVLIMHGAEHLLGELHIPLVGFQNLLGIITQMTQLEKEIIPEANNNPTILRKAMDILLRIPVIRI